MICNKKNKTYIYSSAGIMTCIVSIVVLVSILTTGKSTPTKQMASSFQVIPLGTSGGLDESNLSAYLLTSVNGSTPNSAYISLDGGTLRHGIEMAIKENALPSQIDAETFIREQIKAYLISHGHLDHISGFILNTPNDKPGKTIFGLNQTINIIRQSYFNDQAWADFGPTGLKTYNYEVLDPLSTRSIPIPNTDLNVQIFRLCHTCPFLSSAFLVSRHGQPSASILYLGDTGPDDIEKITHADNTTHSPRYLEQMWRAIGANVPVNQLKAIFIEVSYPNERPDHLLFGHLTPKWLVKELNVLRLHYPLDNVRIVITHIKPERGSREKIIEQLTAKDHSDFNFIFPRQGQAIWL